uniref:Pyroglutamyl-peptidase I n=1 Tax=Odontella aurita TaxID=265563 RepID=A0A7S4IL09_9STRA|mmetsp:Transcript_26692/g.78861  ORF Transcript_26692/g.78861 Transcript_26692/m.78861 type:complete len:268 (+) Transcript_26692:119-922(+)
MGDDQVSFVLTGFGPFRGVADNPTTTLVGSFAGCLTGKSVDEHGNAGGTVCRLSSEMKQIAPHVIKAVVFETSAKHVKSEINRLIGEIAQASVTGPQHVVLLHLGVNYKGLKFQIERCAYNDASFRIPDEDGFQPKRECVLDASRENISWGGKLSTTLNVDSLRRELANTGGFGDDVAVSGDPGRFVCNYTYCYSLDKAQLVNSTRSCGEFHGNDISSSQSVPDLGSVPTLHSLFLHVPPFETQGEDRQLEFVVKLIKAIRKQLSAV